jgi:outer membrane protein, heavy metal efflux system
MPRVLSAVLCGWLCLCACTAYSQTVLTYDSVLERARTQSGAPAVARARIAEAQSGLLDASARLQHNPVVEAAAGPRLGNGARNADLDLGVSQTLDTGGSQRARIDQASAGVDRRRAEADAATQLAIYEAAAAFINALAATERLRVIEQAAQIDRDLLAATERRYSAGDISAIDLNLARLASARATADASSASATVLAALGRLRRLLRIPSDEPLRLDGSLERPSPSPLAQLEAMLPRRPEFALLETDERDAAALTRLGIAAGRPELGLRAGFEREDGDLIVLGGVTLTLPAFQRGASQVAAGAAVATRAKLERDVLRSTSLIELRSAHAVHEQRLASATAFASSALPIASENEQLAQRSYDAGEMSLMDLLQIRRSAVDARLSVADLRLDAALDRLELDRIAGVFR